MGLNVRTIVACAIPTAVAVIGLIFFWTRKKPEPDKRKKEQSQETKEKKEPKDVLKKNKPVLPVVEEPIEAVSSEPVQASVCIEEEIVCSVAESSECAVTPSFVDYTESSPITASDFSQLQSEQDSSPNSPSECATTDTHVDIANGNGECTCPDGAEVKPVRDAGENKPSISDRKRVDSGLEETQADNIVNGTVDSYDAKPPVDRPANIPLSPRRPPLAESPNEHLNNSDSVSEASEVSNDSGKGASVVENHVLSNGEIQMYRFVFPSDLCGRFVGKHGRNINEIKDRTGTQITLVRQPFAKDEQLCCIEGMESDIQSALQLIKKRFPPKQFPNINYEPIGPVRPAQSPVLSPDLMQLKLPMGVSSDVIVSSIVDASQLFLQQPTHPTFPSLERLNQCMMTCYTQDMTVPPLPQPVEGGVICAAPVMEGWYRAQVVTPPDEAGECDIKFLDYGGFSRVQVGDLRQIRSDFMSLPFQATEVYTGNIAPLSDEEGFSLESAAILEELTQGRLLQCQIVTVDPESGVPFVHLYSVGRDSMGLPVSDGHMSFINRDLVNRGVVRWMEA